MESRVAIESYVSQYARLLAQDSRRLGNMRASLKSGDAFVETSFCAVAMIDISKYSKITSSLAQYGKISSEIMTKSVGLYLNKILNVVAMYHGDIVKFLGDALLIAFHPLEKDEDHATIVQRAIVCCSHILERHAMGKITTKMLNLNSPSSAQIDDKAVGTYASKGSTLSSGGGLEDQDLRLHIAITSGEVQNIIVGSYDDRLDYCISGKCMNALDEILSSAKPGELGLDAINVVDLLKDSGVYMNFPRKISSNKPVVVTGSQILEAMSVKGDNSDSSPLPGEVNLDADENELDDEKVANMYMTKTGLKSVKKLATNNTVNGDSQRDIMSRFVNKALVHKLKSNNVVTQPDSAIATHLGEFRKIVVVFSKLNFEFDAKKSQTVMTLFLNAIHKYGGTFQQYSIDDKGQTMLAVFGLPPYTHANEPLEATKAVASFYSELANNDISGIATGMSAGPILFSEVGTDYRREAGLLGEVFNTAARLMSLSKSDVVMDEPTRIKIGDVFTIESQGLHQIKGRDSALEVFKLIHNQNAKPDAYTGGQKTFGYKKEKELLSELINHWSSDETSKGLTIVEGLSGMGKTVLSDFVTAEAEAKNVLFCLSQGTEIRQQTPFFCCRPIINLIVDKTHLAMNDREASAGRPSQTKRSTASYSMISVKDNMMDRMARMLIMYGEDPLQAQLFTVAFTELDESDSSNSDDLKTKLTFFKALMHRLLIRFTKMYKTVFLIDDAQWADVATLSLILDVADGEANAFLGLFTRPYKDNPQLDKLKSLPHCLHFQLNGLTISDVEEMIVYKLGILGQSIKVVDTNIANAVLHRSDGSPLFIDLMAEQLYSAINTSVKIENGCLQPCESSLDLESFLCQSIGSGIMMQYDRLQAEFKQILRVSCIMGQYFNIKDVCEVGKMALSPDQVIEAIQKFDTFKYLTIAPGDHHDTDYSYMAFFRHISIYDSLSYTERSEMNTTAAKYFESQLDANNRYMLLPLVIFHYSNTENCVKFINYAEELGIHYITNCSFDAGISIIQSLIDYVELNHTMITEYANKCSEKNFLTDIRAATWYAYLCTGHSELRHFNNDQFTMRIATKAINLTSLKRIPTDPKQYPTAMLKAMLRVWRLWIQTKGGTQEGPRLSHTEQREHAIVRRALLAAVMAFNYEHNTSLELAGLVIFELLACTILTAYKHRINWCQTLAQASYSVSIAVPFLSDLFLRQAMKLWVPTEKNMDPVGTGVRIFVHHHRLELDLACAMFEDYMKKNDQRGDTVGSFTGVAVHCTQKFLQGDAYYLDVFMNERLPPPAQRDFWVIYYNVFTASMIYLRGKNEAIESIHADYISWFDRSPVMDNELGYVQRHYMGILKALCHQEPEVAFDEFKAMGESMDAKFWIKPYLASYDILLIFPFPLFGFLRMPSSVALRRGKESCTLIKRIINVVKVSIGKNLKVHNMVLPLYQAFAALCLGKQAQAAKKLRKDYESRSKILEKMLPVRALYYAYLALYDQETREKEELVKEVNRVFIDMMKAPHFASLLFG
ncbi:hypothetical protein HDV05_000050 [Chytridiales sp. JEL 0842]|nr:hypothetical protein HDV05_000050 [Chytridiales sp. JEL 0842]